MAEERFSASVDAWVARSREAMRAVWRQSVVDTIIIMQTPVGKGGNMPVDTGFLRSSLDVTLNREPTGFIQKGAEFLSAEAADAQYTLTIGGAEIGDTIYAVYLASYAVHQEYGTSRMAGRGFVRLAAQQWQQTVNRNVARLRR